MKLIAGSYEKFLWGWQIGAKKGSLNGVFSYPAHQGPIKCLDSCGSTVASGGSDDIIKVFDINESKDLGSLHAHSGSITSLQFFKAENSVVDHPTNLLSSSEDGTIGIWDTETWTHLKFLKHKSAVNGVAVHKSGKVGLAVDRSGHLKMWNLLTGRCTYTNKLASEATLIQFSPESSETYALVQGRTVDIHDVFTGQVVHTYVHDKQVLCLGQIQDSLVVSAGEDRAIYAWDNRSGKVAIQYKNAHKSRVKGVCALNAAESLTMPHFFASASSDGSVKIWDSRVPQKLEDGGESEAAIETTTTARLTCLVSCGSAKRLESIPLTSFESANARTESPNDIHEAGGVNPEDGVNASKEDEDLNARKQKKKKYSESVKQLPAQRLNEAVKEDSKARKQKKKKSSERVEQLPAQRLKTAVNENPKARKQKKRKTASNPALEEA